MTPHPMKIPIVIFQAALSMASLAAGAQSYICPNGPGPGERLLGTSRASPGVASMPICEAVGSANPDVPLTVFYGAFAAPVAAAGLSWTWDYPGESQAARAAVSGCEHTTQKRCELLGTFRNTCVAIAANPEYKRFHGVDPSREQAQLKAMQACNSGSPLGLCQLEQVAICAGPSYPRDYNALANTITSDELLNRSARLDPREYWGAVAASAAGKVVQAVTNHPSRAEAERAVLAAAQCATCHVHLTYKNSCVGVAWPANDQAGFVTVLDPDPARAHSEARAQCQAKHGKCVAAANCSGHMSLKDFPWRKPQQ